MTTDLTAQMAQKQNLVRFYRDTQLMEDKRQEEALRKVDEQENHEKSAQKETMKKKHREAWEEQKRIKE